MKVLAGGCRVYSSADGEVSTEGNRTARAVVNAASGARHITQTVSEYAPGRSPPVAIASAEEVLYVASGEAACIIRTTSGTTKFPLRPGAAVYIPPGTAYNIENAGPDTLR